ncbi:hypothetical protein [Hydrogenophaga sp.]|uniref:hypothetical protein n=1 Tax=Hydrogenophaga sp. TaxID=1904254 RepID=UPI003F6E95B1
MKVSQSLEQALSDISRMETTGDIRRVGAEMLLALARKEISATDVDAAAKMVAAQAAHMMAEVKTAVNAQTIREKGGDIGRISHMGRTLIGTPDAA